MPVGTYAAKVALYGYNVSGFIFDNYSNEVAVENKSCEVRSRKNPKNLLLSVKVYI